MSNKNLSVSIKCGFIECKHKIFKYFTDKNFLRKDVMVPLYNMMGSCLSSSESVKVISIVLSDQLIHFINC